MVRLTQAPPDRRGSGSGNQLDGTWWSSAEYDTYLACYRYLVYVNSDVYRGICDKRIGFPVRCLRDD